jgi:Domain of unknown function (DUF4260)
MLNKPRWLLHLEGSAIVFLSMVLYAHGHFRWSVFAAWFLAPDLFLLGYLAHVRVGSALYNLAHTLAGPLALLSIGLLLPAPQLFPYGLIWLSHIGCDRMLGYGLKYPTHFKDTHLQRV